MSQFEKFKTSEDAAKHAESCGFEVYRGNEKTLLLDIDSGNDFRKFELNRDLIDELVGIDDYTIWNSQSDKHHVLLRLKKPLSIELRLFIQACLGSDVKKELLTYKRILEGETEPVMLFRPRKWGNKWKNQANKRSEGQPILRDRDATSILAEQHRLETMYENVYPASSHSIPTINRR